MAISLMAARLFENAFKNLDFTGWPEFVNYGDTSAARMMLSTDKKDMNMYSIIVNSRETDQGTGYTFTLMVEQVASQIKDGRYQFLIKDVAIHEIKGIRKIGICVGRGQDIILDVLDRPAYKEENDQPEYDDDDEEYDDDSEDDAEYDEEQEYIEPTPKKEPSIFCSNCGEENSPKRRTCHNCGATLTVPEFNSRTRQPYQDEEEEESEDDEEESEPEHERQSLKDRFAIRKESKKQHKDLVGKAKMNRPPKGKFKLSNHRKP